ncbi:MAG: hypothetical protein KJ871_17600 [Alphaproteobacteria bacterium]|nr:hypothetical protein [Alphaproteobacteria bacterium]MBU2082830.1 hypothetical protein [Alphaproteobacteria bacterium]MBU2142986.1 hypothetical protein [Alphaproteobacteria bacterium]MBU2196580.1 hypothetical protein [Alphaproteobacteria bacterium]
MPNSPHRALPYPKPGTTLIVMGNGPSLRDFDFGRLSGVDTLGMNAAYRHWDRIDWRPTHYACLDDALIDTHHAEIKRLIKEGRIHTFFLSGHILEIEPGLADHENVHFLDTFVPFWHKTRGQGHGLEFIDSNAFRTQHDAFITTGAYSVRYGAFLGYECIALLGIDLTYYALSEAEPVGDLRLVMTETPTSNPNYFFDDYQQEGDAFQVPNPDNHEEELHVAAFEAVRDDFLREQVPVQLINSNRDSRLNAEAILPFGELSTVLDEASLGSVIVPLTAGEQDQALDNLWLWSQPAFFPFLGPAPSRKPDLIFVCNNAAAATCETRVHDFLAGEPRLRQCFDLVRFVTLDLSGDADLYRRENYGPQASEGFRAGPNNLFFAAMDAVRDHWGYSLYIETDCIPVRPDWVGRINAHLQGAEPAWITGSIYRGSDPLGPREKRHMNGNAIYATGESEFQNFVSTVWRPKLSELVTQHPEMPFDCLIEALYDLADAEQGKEDPVWQTIREASHKFRYSALIPNLTGDSTSLHALADQVQDLLHNSPNSCLIHARRLAALIAHMRISGTKPSAVELLGLLREAADGLPPRAAASRHKRKGQAGWTVDRVRQGLARRLPPLRRFID